MASRTITAALAALALLLAAGAAQASAATVRRDGNFLFFADPAGEVNDLTVSVEPGGTTYRFHDRQPVTATPGSAADGDQECRQDTTTPGDALCPRTGVTPLIDLGDGDDQNRFQGLTDFTYVQVSGGAGDDVLRPTFYTGFLGGPGKDTYADTTDRAILVYYTDKEAPVTVTLDGAANDGEAGEGENVPSRATVVGGQADDTLTGEDGPNGLYGYGGNDSIRGGAGNDVLLGDDGNDTIQGDTGGDAITGGNGDDTELGGPGRDRFAAAGGFQGTNDEGADRIDGGADFDLYDRSLDNPSATPLAVTLAGSADDGEAGERDDLSGVEDVIGGPTGDTLTGSAGSDQLDGRAGNDTLDGGGGPDFLFGGSGDDTLRARDGAADRVDCSDGNDTAEVDQLDDVGASCETVRRSDAPSSTPAPTPTTPAEDRPPTVAFTSPAEGATLGGRAATTTVTVDASDDRRVARVLLVDDGRVIASDDSAPYSFAYRPTGDDVGRDTLSAVAVDSADQTATAFRAVRVNRFLPTRVTARVAVGTAGASPVLLTTTGRVRPPAGLTARTACRGGRVAVQVKRGTRTISTRRTRLRADCAFASSVRFADSARLGRNGRLRVFARFLGSAVLAPRAAAVRTVRLPLP